MSMNHDMIKKCRHQWEWTFFGLAAVLTLSIFCMAVGISLYRDQAVSFTEHELIQSYKQDHAEAATLSDAEVVKRLPEDDKELIKTIKGLYFPLVLLAPLGLLLLMIYQIGTIFGGLRADGIKAGPQQFGEVYALWTDMAQELGFKKIPDLYIKNGNGTLNAFATCIPGYRRLGAIYSDILERALANQDEDVLRFVLGHELGHIRLGHVYWWYFLLTVAANFPGIRYVVGLPLSRAREYGCDKVGAHLAGDTCCKGLLMLAAGKHLYRQVDLSQYEAAHIHERSAWDVVHNFFIDHPNISWRIAALRQNRHGDLFWAGQRNRQPAAEKTKVSSTS